MKDLSTFVGIGLPNTVALIIGYFAYEQMTLAAGFIGIAEQASQVILINLTMFAYMTAYGMQSPGCATVGQQLGRCNIPKAYQYLRAAFSVFIVVLVIELAVFWFCKRQLIDTMTDIQELRESVDAMYLLFMANIVVDGIRGMLRGPIYALGLMRRLLIWNVLFQCILMPSLIYYFVYVKKMGLYGIWTAKVIADAGNTVMYALTLLLANWHKIAYGYMKKRIADCGVLLPEHIELEKQIKQASFLANLSRKSEILQSIKRQRESITRKSNNDFLK